MTEKIQCIVIGAGVVGLSVARELCLRGIETCVVEQRPTFGTESSSRNSEVIHAGIYYSPNSLKARLCVTGKKLLYQYCKERNIPHSNTGKLVVANNDAQLASLKSIVHTAKNNGVSDLQILSYDEIREKEPSLDVKHALFSPSSGILDSHQYMLSLIGDIENNGGFIVYNTEFANAEKEPFSWRVTLKDSQVFELKCHQLVNCAGLHAETVANNISKSKHFPIPNVKYAKGNYFAYHGKHNFKHLVYPVPEKDGLGIHLTLDLSGQIRFGPDVEWIEHIDYQVNSRLAKKFYKAIRSYWPEVEEERLSADYSGIRAKIFTQHVAHQDFIVQQAIKSNSHGLINLFGIESPGLTASLALGIEVAKMLD